MQHNTCCVTSLYNSNNASLNHCCSLSCIFPNIWSLNYYYYSLLYWTIKYPYQYWDWNVYWVIVILTAIKLPHSQHAVNMGPCNQRNSPARCRHSGRSRGRGLSAHFWPRLMTGHTHNNWKEKDYVWCQHVNNQRPNCCMYFRLQSNV